MVMLTAAEVLGEGDDIVRVRFLEGVGVELEHAEEIIEAVLRTAAHRLHGNLVDARQLLFISTEARQRLAKQNPVALSGTAILVASKLQRTLANMYLSIARPETPTRLFDSEADAHAWLDECNRSARRRSSERPISSRK